MPAPDLGLSWGLEADHDADAAAELTARADTTANSAGHVDLFANLGSSVDRDGRRTLVEANVTREGEVAVRKDRGTAKGDRGGNTVVDLGLQSLVASDTSVRFVGQVGAERSVSSGTGSHFGGQTGAQRSNLRSAGADFGGEASAQNGDVRVGGRQTGVQNRDARGVAGDCSSVDEMDFVSKDERLTSSQRSKGCSI